MRRKATHSADGLGERIAELRALLGLSSASLAGHLGVSQRTVEGWESGTYIPELRRVLAMEALAGDDEGGLRAGGGAWVRLTTRRAKAAEEVAARPKRRRGRRRTFLVAGTAAEGIRVTITANGAFDSPALWAGLDAAKKRTIAAAVAGDIACEGNGRADLAP